MHSDSISICVVNIDYVMAYIESPYGFVDQTSDGPRPVVRVFGSCARSGRRSCVYLHGVSNFTSAAIVFVVGGDGGVVVTMCCIVFLFIEGLSLFLSEAG